MQNFPLLLNFLFQFEDESCNLYFSNLPWGRFPVISLMTYLTPVLHGNSALHQFFFRYAKSSFRVRLHKKILYITRPETILRAFVLEDSAAARTANRSQTCSFWPCVTNNYCLVKTKKKNTGVMVSLLTLTRKPRSV
jgi:hypothetical protein